LQIICQNTEYWCWWNPGSSWYFLARRSTILCKKVRHKFHTSFICWCFRPFWPLIIRCGDMSFTKTSSPVGTILRSTVCSPQTSRKALWISVGFLLHQVSVLMYDLWSSTVTVPEAPADAMSNARQCKTAYTSEVMNTRAASSGLQL
jgi:hypothetical protein